MHSLDYFILGAVFGLFIFYKLFCLIKSKKQQRKLKIARRAENTAIRYLQKAGYKILDIQKRVQVKTKIDGELYSNTIIADMVVQKQGKQYLVEVKTGKQTEKITAPAIRRQLLEYYLIFKPHGLLFLDMMEKKLHRIEFQIDGTSKHELKTLFNYGLAFCLGIGATLLVLIIVR